MFRVYALCCLLVFGCQYQCNKLPEKTCLRNDLLCAEWDVKPYTVSLLCSFYQMCHDKVYCCHTVTEKFACEIAVDSTKVSEALVSAVKADDSPMRFAFFFFFNKYA